MKPLPGTWWIEPGRLLGGAHPASRSMADTLSRIEALLDLGMTAFVDLTEPGETAPYEALLGAGATQPRRELQYTRMPMPDHGVPSTPQTMKDILAHLDRALAGGHAVYLHCRAGIGRTGLVAGCHLVDKGMAPEQAQEHLQQLWQQAGRTSVWPHTPETDEQMDYIRRWNQDSAQSPPPPVPWWKRMF
jgi:hypothetical protein